MNQIVLAIFDVAAGTYQQPFFCPTVGVGLRSLQDELSRDPKSVFAQHPQDFEVFRFGEFSPVLGFVNMVDKPELITRVSSLISVGV